MQQRKEGLNHNMPYFVFMFVCCVREKGVVVGIEILLWEGHNQLALVIVVFHLIYFCIQF